MFRVRARSFVTIEPSTGVSGRDSAAVKFIAEILTAVC